MPDVAEIAGRLSVRQQLALINDVRYGNRGWQIDRCIAGLRNHGLVEPNSSRLTPLGLAVRAYLENSREAMPRPS